MTHTDWQRCRGKEPLYAIGETESRTFWRITWRFLKKLKVEPPYAPYSWVYISPKVTSSACKADVCLANGQLRYEISLGALQQMNG